MAVGLAPPEQLQPVPGVRLGTTAAGVRKPGRTDLVVIECAPGSEVAAVFTRNRFCAAPVTVARDHLAAGAPRALLINTGCANAGTGQAGIEAARACCVALARRMGCAPEQVLPFSTGVIGEPLPVDRIVAGLDGCLAACTPDGWAAAAAGIMTTDTVPKARSVRVDLPGSGPVTITGMAKGAGMIRPDMATMLAYVATDAAVERPLLQDLLVQAVTGSFNRITVDGDTSTNDACLLIATGQCGMAPVQDRADPRCAPLAAGLADVLGWLARAIVRDAEGATKFLSIVVEGGASEADCLAVAYTVAHSPLVKTAAFASDPNWGRILAAVGRAPVTELDVTRVALTINGAPVVRAGEPVAGYDEAAGRRAMAPAEIEIRIGLGAGAASATVWTSDLSHEYVRVNAEYRT